MSEFRFHSHDRANWESAYELLRDVEDYSIVRYDEITKLAEKTETEEKFYKNFIIIKFAIDIFASLYLKTDDNDFIVSFKLNEEMIELPNATFVYFDQVCPGPRKNSTLLMHFLNLTKDKERQKIWTYLLEDFNLVELKRTFSFGQMDFQLETETRVTEHEPTDQNDRHHLEMNLKYYDEMYRPNDSDSEPEQKPFVPENRAGGNNGKFNVEKDFESVTDSLEEEEPAGQNDPVKESKG